MNDVPDSVWSTVLSRSSLRNCTCGAISEPNAAVAIRQPPPCPGTGDVLPPDCANDDGIPNEINCT